MSDHLNVIRSLTYQDGLLLLGIIVGTSLLLRINKRIFQYISDHTSAETRYRIMSFQPLLRLAILIGAISWIFNILIIPTPENLLTILGAAGLALGFAFREYISSLIAGIITLYEGPYKPGDWIQIGDIYGEVKSVGMRAIKIHTADDELVHVPLIQVWETSIRNYNYGSTNLMSVTEIYVRPNQEYDYQEIKSLLYKVALSSSYTQVQKPIRITMSNQIHGLKFQIKSYPIDPRDQFRYETDLSIKASEALQRKGIELTEFH